MKAKSLKGPRHAVLFARPKFAKGVSLHGDIDAELAGKYHIFFAANGFAQSAAEGQFTVLNTMVN